MSVKDFTLIAILLLSISLMVNTIRRINRSYGKGTIPASVRDSYILITLLVPLLGALLANQKLNN